MLEVVAWTMVIDQVEVDMRLETRSETSCAELAMQR